MDSTSVIKGSLFLSGAFFLYRSLFRVYKREPETNVYSDVCTTSMGLAGTGLLYLALSSKLNSD